MGQALAPGRDSGGSGRPSVEAETVTAVGEAPDCSWCWEAGEAYVARCGQVTDEGVLGPAFSTLTDPLGPPRSKDWGPLSEPA